MDLLFITFEDLFTIPSIFTWFPISLSPITAAAPTFYFVGSPTTSIRDEFK